MLLTENYYFGATPLLRAFADGRVGAPHGNFGAGVRVFRGLIYNEGDADVVVTLDGSPVDSGYGLNWTSRVTVTVPARSKKVIEGAIRGNEEHWRLTSKTSSGVSEGRVELFDVSDNLKR